MIAKVYIKNLLCGFILISYTATAAPDEPVEVANKKAQNYHKLLLKRPGNATVFDRFVNAWLDTGEKKGLSAWLKQKAESGAVADLRVLSAYYEYLGEDVEALKTLSRAVDKEPANAGLRLARAKMLARTLDFESALKDLDLASKDEKLGIEASKLKGIYLARSGQIKEAVAAWKEVIARFPKDVELREDLIELLVVEGLYDDAVTSSKELITMTKDPYLKVVRQMRLADIQILAGSSEEGLNTYKQVLDATGEGTWIEREILARFGKIYLREDNIKGLRDLYQEIREKYPRRISIQKALAHQMAATGEINEAIELFKEVIKITPGNMKNRQEFMDFLEKNEKWEEAKTELTDLLKSRENDPVLWQKLAQLEQQLGNKEGVKGALNHVWEIKKSTPEGIITTATLYDQAELKVDAEERLREGVKLFADSDEVKEGLASFLIQNKKEKEAIEIWSEIVKGAPRDVLLRVVRSLTGHEKSSEAFQLLLERVEEFENDVLVISKICSLVNDEKKAELVLSHALNLINKATTPTDLETYMRLTVQVINTGEKEQEIISQLSEKETPTIAECCLLAELFTDTGDTIGATKYLEKAEGIDQGLLAKFYRVHYNESRGDIGKAIAMMENILESPEGRKTVYMRRLVGLLQREDKLDEALERTEEWKRMAPGDRAAWQRRADILSLLGQTDESVNELRRMLGKFGSEETLRASLASRLLESGDILAAKKIYEQLYDEADSSQGKLKWVAKLALLAQQEGDITELLESFDQRSRSNPQSIEPLLAKAEVYRVLNQYKERREVLIQATEKRPDDPQLLIRLAEVEERAGELHQAIATLREAVRLDKTFGAKSQLARLLIANGETSEGLSLLAQISTESSDPRKVEKTMESLIKSGEPEMALSYWKNLPQHHADWRLLYLKGICLMRMNEEQKAYDVFVSMKGVSGEIKGVKPLMNPQWREQLLARGNSNYPTFKGWNELSHYFNYIREEERTVANLVTYGRNYSSGGAFINLPGTPREAACLGILRAALLADRFSKEKKRTALEKLSIEGVEELGLFLLSSLNQQKRNNADFDKALAERLEQEPNNPVLLTYTLGSIKPESAPSKERALEMIEAMKAYNKASAINAIRTMQKVNVLSVEESITYSLDIYAETDGKEKDELMSMMIYMLNQFTDLDEASQQRIAKFRAVLLQRIYQMEEEPVNSWWVRTLFTNLVTNGEGDEVVPLINHLCKWEKNRKPAQKQAVNSWRNYGYGRRWGSHSRGYTGTYLIPPPQYLLEHEGIHPLLLNMISNYNQRQQRQSFSSIAIPVVDEEQKKLLKLLNAKTVKKKAPVVQARNHDVELFEVLKGKTEQITHRGLRAMILIVTEEGVALKALMKQFEKSENYSELLMAAGYLHEQEGNHLKVYEILKRISTLSGISASNRKKLDGHLVYIGGLLAKDKSSEVDLELAQRAALRLRKSINQQEKVGFFAAMKTLGLSDEVERMAQKSKRAVTSTRGRNVKRPLRGLALARKLVSEEKKEEAIRVLVKEIRNSFKQGTNGRSQLNSYVTFLKKHDLVEVTLKKMLPGEGGSFNQRLTYAGFCMVLGKSEQAVAAYDALLKDRPNSVEALGGWVSASSDAQEIKKRLIIRNGDGKIDAVKMNVIFAKMLRDSDNNVVIYLNMLSAMASVLEEVEPSMDKDVNLSWVNYYTARLVQDNYFQGHRLVGLMGANSSRTVTEKDAKKSAERDTVARRLFESMIRHPQTAEQGFILLHAAKERLKITEEDVLKFAKLAAVEMIRRPAVELPRYGSNTTWNHRGIHGLNSTNGPSNSVDPVTYLTSLDTKTEGTVLSEELLESIEKHQPKRYKMIQLVQSLNKVSEKEALAHFKKWESELPENVHEKSTEIYNLADVLLLTEPKNTEWTKELQKAILEDPNRGYSGSSWSQARMQWAKWLHKTQGSDACQQFIEEMIAKRIAPKEKWPILVKLGNKRLPNEYQQNIYAVESVLENMYTDTTLSGVAIRVIIENDFSEVFTRSSYNLRNSWRVTHSSPEAFIKWLKKQGFINKRKKGAAFKPSSVFFVSEGATRIRLKDSKMKEAAAKLLMEDKDFNPVLAQVLAAKMLGSAKGREIISKTIANNPKDFAALKVSSKLKAHALMKYWFPTLTSDGSNKKTEQYLKTFRKDLLAEAKSKAATWMKEGITLNKNGSIAGNYNYIPHVIQIIQHDPYEGAKLWLKIINDVRSQSSILAAGNPYHQANSEPLYDQWNRQLFSKILSSSSSSISRINQIKFIHRLYHDDADHHLMELSSYQSSSGYYFWRNLEAYVKTKKVAEGKTHQTLVLAVEEMAKELTEDEQATMMVLLQNGLLGRMSMSSKDSAKYLQWVSARYAGKSDPVAIGIKAFGLQRTRRYISTKPEEKEIQQKEQREALLRFLQFKGLSVIMRVESIKHIANSSSAQHLLASEEVWREITELIGEYNKGKRSGYRTIWPNVMSELVGVRFDGREKVSGALAREAEGFLGSLQLFDSSDQEKLTKNILLLGSEGGAMDIVRRHLNTNLQEFRGDLSVMLSLAKHGDFDLAKRLIVTDRMTYKTSELGPYDKDFQKLSQDLIQNMPEKSKYRLEVLLANVRDPSDPKPEVSKKDRIIALAERYRKEKPSARAAKIELLALLSAHLESAAFVEKELFEVASKTSFGKLVLTHSGSEDRHERDQLASILKRTTKMHIQAGRYEEVAKDLKSLRLIKDSNDAYQAASNVSEILKVTTPQLLLNLLKNQEDAKRMLPLAEEITKCAAALGSRNSNARGYNEPISIMIYCLAGQTDTYDKLIESMPEEDRATYLKYLAYNNSYRVQYLASSKWKSKESEVARRQILTTLLGSEWFVGRVDVMKLKWSDMIRYGLLSKEDFEATLTTVPDENTRKSELLCVQAALALKEDKNPEEIDKVYAEALALAKAQKNEKSEAVVLLRRCVMWANKGKLDRARKWAKQVKSDLLSKDDAALFARTNKKFKKTPKK